MGEGAAVPAQMTWLSPAEPLLRVLLLICLGHRLRRAGADGRLKAAVGLPVSLCFSVCLTDVLVALVLFLVLSSAALANGEPRGAVGVRIWASVMDESDLSCCYFLPLSCC